MNFNTHEKYLRNELSNLIKNTNDKIYCLEFGCGDSSSEIFHSYAKNNKNIEIVSFESDYDWLMKISKKYSLNNYIFKYVENWNELFNDNVFNDISYDLIFVDQKPWEARLLTIDFFKNNDVKTIMLHDYDYFNLNMGLNDIRRIDEDSFYGKYLDYFDLIQYSELLPPTLVMKKKN